MASATIEQKRSEVKHLPLVACTVRWSDLVGDLNAVFQRREKVIEVRIICWCLITKKLCAGPQIILSLLLEVPSEAYAGLLCLKTYSTSFNMDAQDPRAA
jgi:hypothetical protein